MKNEKNLVVAPALSSKNEAENAKNQTTPETVTPTEETTQQTPEKIKTEVIEELKKRLETELKRINNKKEIAEKREFFLDCSFKVDNFIKELETVETFETNICRLTFQTLQTDNYSRNNFNDYLTISNTALIGKFCNALKQEINAKIENLEMELLKA